MKSVASEVSGTGWTLRRRFELVVIGLLYLLVYAPQIPGLVGDWYAHRNFSYGFFIPLISIFLLWRRRDVFHRLPPRGSLLGGIPLAAAILIWMVGNALEESFFVRFSMILALGGVTQLLLGLHYVRSLLFPIAYLLLMIPIPYAIVKEISFVLRIFHATLSAAVLNVSGIPVHRDADSLVLPEITLEVADGCSGIASLFAMTALGTLYAYMLPVRFGAKLAVVIGGVIFPVLANLLRIILTGALVYHFGKVALDDALHRFSGTFTFLLSLLMTVAFGEVLRRRAGPAPGSMLADQMVDAGYQNAGPGANPAFRLLRPSAPFLLAVAIFIFPIYFSVATTLGSSPRIPLRSELQSLAVRIGPYDAVDPEWPDPYRDPYAGNVLSRIYAASSGEPIELFIGYRDSQSNKHRLRSPKLYLTGDWNFIWVKPERIALLGGEAFEANWMLARKGGARRLVLYWYVAQGEPIGSEVSFRMRLLKGILLGSRTDGAVIRIAASIQQGEDPERANERIKGFVFYFHPRLQEILPR